MKVKKTVWRAAGLLLIGTLAFAESSSSEKAAAPAGDAGAKPYAAKCASCHGKDGAGNPAMGKVLKVDPIALDMTAKPTQDKSDAELAKLITDGVGKMPAYKGKLTDADIQATVAYLRTLAAKKK